MPRVLIGFDLGIEQFRIMSMIDAVTCLRVCQT